MFFINNILFYLLIFTNSNASANNQIACENTFNLAPDVFRICYISLNNKEEMKQLKDKYKDSPNIEIVELMANGTNPNQSVRNSLDALRTCLPHTRKNNPCNGLVVSGHQNGSFWGDLAEGELTPEDLLLLSCDYPNIFNNINSVWLQGCNTIDEDIHKTKNETSSNHNSFLSNITSIIRRSNSPRFHQDESNYHITDRYASSFPESIIHGWEGIAPGVTSSSPKSMILHLQEILILLDETDGVHKSKDEVMLYLRDQIRSLKGRGLTSDINEDFSSSDFMDQISTHLQTILSGAQYQCLWQTYQQKYFGTGNVDLRRPRSIDSASSRDLPSKSNLCSFYKEANNHYGSSTDGEMILEEAINDPNFLNNYGFALSRVIDQLPPHTKQHWQNKIKSMPQIKDYFITRLQTNITQCKQSCSGDYQCNENCNLTINEQLELDIAYYTLTGTKLGRRHNSIKNDQLNNHIIESLEALQATSLSPENERLKQELQTELTQAQQEVESIISTFNTSHSKNITSIEQLETQINWCLHHDPNNQTNDCQARHILNNQTSSKLSRIIELQNQLDSTQLHGQDDSLEILKTIELAGQSGRIDPETWDKIILNMSSLPSYMQKRISDISLKSNPSNPIRKFYYGESTTEEKSASQLLRQVKEQITNEEARLREQEAIVLRPTTNKPTTNKPTTNKPTTNKPTTNKPTTNKPITTGKCNKNSSYKFNFQNYRRCSEFPIDRSNQSTNHYKSICLKFDYEAGNNNGEQAKRYYFSSDICYKNDLCLRGQYLSKLYSRSGHYWEGGYKAVLQGRTIYCRGWKCPVSKKYTDRITNGECRELNMDQCTEYKGCIWTR